MFTLAIIISKIHMLIKATTEYQTRVNALQSAAFAHLPPKTKEGLRQYLHQHIDKFKSQTSERELMAMLPRRQRDNLLFEANKDCIKALLDAVMPPEHSGNDCFISRISEDTFREEHADREEHIVRLVRRFSQVVRTEVFLQNDLIMMEGDSSHGVYLLRSGTVEFTVKAKGVRLRSITVL